MVEQNWEESPQPLRASSDRVVRRMVSISPASNKTCKSHTVAICWRIRTRMIPGRDPQLPPWGSPNHTKDYQALVPELMHRLASLSKKPRAGWRCDPMKTRCSRQCGRPPLSWHSVGMIMSAWHKGPGSGQCAMRMPAPPRFQKAALPGCE